MDHSQLKRCIAELTKYMGEKGVIIDPLPRLVLKADPQLTNQILCPTAHYSPVNQSITLHTAGRHPKDILRSYAHELYHHHQNCEGRMPKEALEGADNPKYAQSSKTLRDLEAEAYMKGNLLFRDWTDLKTKGA